MMMTLKTDATSATKSTTVYNYIAVCNASTDTADTTTTATAYATTAAITKTTSPAALYHQKYQQR